MRTLSLVAACLLMFVFPAAVRAQADQPNREIEELKRRTWLTWGR